MHPVRNQLHKTKYKTSDAAAQKVANFPGSSLWGFQLRPLRKWNKYANKLYNCYTTRFPDKKYRPNINVLDHDAFLPIFFRELLHYYNSLLCGKIISKI